MTLPRIVHPTFKIEIPSNKKVLQISLMRQKEEKILLMAKEAGDPTGILDALRQVVNNCSVSEGFNIDDLTIFDLEYCFIRLRAVSVSNTTKVSYKDNTDGEIRDFDVDLSKVTIEFPKEKIDKIIVNEAIYLTTKWPSCKMYSDKEFLNSAGQDAISKMVASVIDKVYNGTNITDFAAATPEEQQEFIGNLPVSAYDKLRDFVYTLPHLHYEIKYKDNEGTEKEIVLSTLNDFFSLS